MVRLVLALILSLSLSRLFLRHLTLFALETVAKEVEAPALFPAVPDMGLIRMKAEGVLRHPGANERKGGFGFFPALAEDHEVIRVTHHLVAMAGHQLIERVQVDVRQQRTDDALNAKDNFSFDRLISGWRSRSVFDLRHKR